MTLKVFEAPGRMVAVQEGTLEMVFVGEHVGEGDSLSTVEKKQGVRYATQTKEGTQRGHKEVQKLSVFKVSKL